MCLYLFMYVWAPYVYDSSHTSLGFTAKQGNLIYRTHNSVLQHLIHFTNSWLPSLATFISVPRWVRLSPFPKFWGVAAPVPAPAGNSCYVRGPPLIRLRHPHSSVQRYKQHETENHRLSSSQVFRLGILMTCGCVGLGRRCLVHRTSYRMPSCLGEELD